MRRATTQEKFKIHELLQQECKRDGATGFYRYPPGITDATIAQRVNYEITASSVATARKELGIRLRDNSRKVKKIDAVDQQDRQMVMQREINTLQKQVLTLMHRVDTLEGKPTLPLKLA